MPLNEIPSPPGRGLGEGRPPRFHTLKVADLRRETADAVSVTFEIPPELADDYAFHPGQYLTLRATIGGEDIRRSYSICSGPDDGELRIAVKRVDGGAFSGWANESLAPGHDMQVMTPTGRFGLPYEPAAARTYVGLAAGSGITPILSLARGILSREPHSQFFLFYGNQSVRGMLFREALEELKDRYLGRFSVFHVLSQEEQDIPILHGRLDAERVRLLLRHIVPASRVDHVFLCGPTGMLDAVEPVLGELGIPPAACACGAVRVRRRRHPPRPAHARGRTGHPHRQPGGGRQPPRYRRRRRREHPGRRPARRHGPALRLQGRHVQHLPRPRGRRVRST